MGTCSIGAHVRGRWQNRNARGGRACPSSGWRPVWPELCEPGGCGDGGDWRVGDRARLLVAPQQTGGTEGQECRGCSGAGGGAPGAEDGGSAVPRARGREGPPGEGPRGEGVVAGTPHPGRTRLPAGWGGDATGPRIRTRARALGTCARELRVPHPRLTPGGTTLELAAGRRSLCGCPWSRSGGPRGGAESGVLWGQASTLRGSGGSREVLL